MTDKDGVLNLIPNKDPNLPSIMVACNTLTAISGETYPYHMKLFYNMGRRHPEYNFFQVFGYRMSIDRFRNWAAEQAIAYGCRYLMFIDDDMTIFQDVFSKLLEGCTMQGYGILAAFNYIRGYPFKIMSFKYDLTSKHKRLRNLVQSDINEVGLGAIIPCDAIGTAVCIISVDTIIRTPKPWFLTGPHGTEDIYFCLDAKAADPNLKIGMHTGAITGHLLEPEKISHDTRNALMRYYEAYMTPEEIAAAQSDLPGLALVPNVGKRQLHYEDIMASEFEPLIEEAGA
jgi:hypothetical protein